IVRILEAREPHRKRAEIWARVPSAFAYEVIVSAMKDLGIRRLAERLLRIHAETYDRPGPGCPIFRILANVFPEDCASLISQFTRKGSIDSDKALRNELLDLFTR